jgi:hypothetical protein
MEGYLIHVRSRAIRLNVQPEPLASASADAVAVNVEPEPGAGGWYGRISITGERALEREVRGARCEDVVAALALITVLRLDERADASAVAPAASPTGASGVAGAAGARAAGGTAVESEPTSPRPESEPSAAAEPPSPEPPGAVPSPDETPPSERAAASDRLAPAEQEPDEPAPGASAAPSSTPDQEPLAAAPEPELPEPLAAEPSIIVPRSEEDVEADAPEVAEEPEPPAEPWHWPALVGGLAAHAGYASVPGHAFRASLEGELRFGESRASWAALLALEYAHGNSPVISGELALTLLSAQLGLCPPAFIDDPSVWVRACVSVRGGGLRSTVASAEPTFVAEFDQNWRPWLALGPTLQAGVPLSERLALRGLAQLAVQLVRDSYYAELRDEELGMSESFIVYEPEAISIEIGLGLGYTF